MLPRVFYFARATVALEIKFTIHGPIKLAESEDVSVCSETED